MLRYLSMTKKTNIKHLYLLGGHFIVYAWKDIFPHKII